MKIIKLSAENVKKLTVVQIEPDPKGGLVIISGKNDAGKSSVLDAIMYALAGKEVLPTKPVRRGQDKAKIEVDLGDYLVTRTITPAGGGSLIVRNKDGQRMESPQTILDGLFSKLTFDPLEFLSMKPPQRSETLQKLVGLDFSKRDEEIDQVFTNRTHVNREVKSLEAQLMAVKEHDGVPKEEVSAAAVLAEQAEAAEKNRQNDMVRTGHAQALAKCGSITDKMVRLGKQADDWTLEIEKCQKALAAVETELAEEKAAYEAAKPVLEDLTVQVSKLKNVDLAPFAGKIKEVEETNAKVRANRQKLALRALHKAKVKDADALTEKIEALEKDKRQSVMDAKFPVEGLSLSDTREVEFGGIPFDEINTASKLRVSVAMGLALNPKLRVLLVRQGNDLDEDNLKLVADMAEKSDAQIWIEVVQSSGQTCVVIEDGHVAQPEHANPCEEKTTPPLSEKDSAGSLL